MVGGRISGCSFCLDGGRNGRLAAPRDRPPSRKRRRAGRWAAPPIRPPRADRWPVVSAPPCRARARRRVATAELPPARCVSCVRGDARLAYRARRPARASVHTNCRRGAAERWLAFDEPSSNSERDQFPGAGEPLSSSFNNPPHYTTLAASRDHAP